MPGRVVRQNWVDTAIVAPEQKPQPPQNADRRLEHETSWKAANRFCGLGKAEVNAYIGENAKTTSTSPTQPSTKEIRKLPPSPPSRSGDFCQRGNRTLPPGGGRFWIKGAVKAMAGGVNLYEKSQFNRRHSGFAPSRALSCKTFVYLDRARKTVGNATIRWKIFTITIGNWKPEKLPMIKKYYGTVTFENALYLLPLNLATVYLAQQMPAPRKSSAPLTQTGISTPIDNTLAMEFQANGAEKHRHGGGPIRRLPTAVMPPGLIRLRNHTKDGYPVYTCISEEEPQRILDSGCG